MKTDKANLGDELRSAVENAEKVAAEWVRENSPQMENIVRRKLDMRVEEVIVKAIGFDKSYGQWSVDHCNGRAGESMVGDWLRANASGVVNQWLSDQIVDLPRLPARAVTALENEYLSMLKAQVRSFLQNEARERAKVLMLDIVKKMEVKL